MKDIASAYIQSVFFLSISFTNLIKFVLNFAQTIDACVVNEFPWKTEFN